MYRAGVEKDEQRIVVSFALLPIVAAASERLECGRIAFLF
jgi:hypothetical protein